MFSMFSERIFEINQNYTLKSWKLLLSTFRIAKLFGSQTEMHIKIKTQRPPLPWKFYELVFDACPERRTT